MIEFLLEYKQVLTGYWYLWVAILGLGAVAGYWFRKILDKTKVENSNIIEKKYTDLKSEYDNLTKKYSNLAQSISDSEEYWIYQKLHKRNKKVKNPFEVK